ncbi:helix-turn-helix domain-containing protein [Parvularcula marina]|uniref:AraC family transcriptional regulator n=1 Tax=Parvularcula marina TaxID=2292771 RepID=A0A371RIJ1_9PROT|nr:helix-turn-helix transcriptional regulator [Parvularcula marina]RFB05248.1 AraC family transcriptional regulator [Parvularcula marina]
MSDTFSTIAYAVASGSIGFAFAMAMANRGQRGDRVLYFRVVLIALLAHVLGQLLVLSGAYRIAPHLVGADLSVKAALGPAVFFYTRALISSEKRSFGGLDWIALLGPLLVILISLPFATLSAEEKLALADPATRNPAHYRIALFTCTGSLVIFLATTAVYLAAALHLQMRHRRQMMEQFANIERKSLDWLRNILFVFAGAWLFFAVKQAFWLSGVSIPAFNVTLAFSESLAIAAFAFLGLHQPALPLGRTGKAEEPARRPILSEERLSKTAGKLRAALNKDSLYADKGLSLRKLSDVTGITKNHISETLSQQLGVNFFDFVNSRRAEEAKRLLAETELTILEVGLEVGFNSRSTFNAAFKKHVGSPPSAYRESARNAGLHAAAKPEKSALRASE